DSDSEPGPGPTRRTVAVPIQGRRAVTHLQVVEHIGGLATVLEVHLETGRTHQIRIHCTHLGHPVLADPQYGVRAPGEPWPAELQAPRMALHARVLGLAHPRTGARLRFESPLPDELAAWLERLRAASAPPAG
ncbi:pseudouridine synthase, partial [Haliangium sp.]|uniref:pseudouridine synthase n=1 Tax=Haliangium sp. TaxID=2663208 RepID=UPI003D127D35